MTWDAWAAGFIDGEGSLQLRPYNRAGTASRRHFPVIAVGQTVIEPLERLQEMYGGNIYLRTPANEKHRPCWAWTITGGLRTRACLERVMPWLVVKREEAEILLAYTLRMRGPSQGNLGRLTDAELAERDEMAVSLSALKSRGRGVDLAHIVS